MSASSTSPPSSLPLQQQTLAFLERRRQTRHWRGQVHILPAPPKPWEIPAATVSQPELWQAQWQCLLQPQGETPPWQLLASPVQPPGMENASTPLVFLFVHGLGGKTLWMHPFVMSLAAALEMQNLPAAFYGLELLAYGGAHPTGQAHFDDRRHLMQTVVAALDHLRARHPEALLVPVGLSLGALVLTHAMALLWKTNQITTLGPLQFCLVSPAFRAARASFGPEIYAQVIRGYALSLMGKPLTAPPIPLPYAENQVLVTRNQAMAEYMHADTRRVTHMSALGYLELLKLTVLDTFRALPRIHSPVLQFMPGCDAVCDSLWMIRGFERIASDEKQLVLFPEAYHDLTVEPEMPLMAAYLAQWASAAIETPPVAPLPLPGQPLPV